MLGWPPNWKEFAPDGFDAPKMNPDVGGDIGCCPNVAIVSGEA